MARPGRLRRWTAVVAGGVAALATVVVAAGPAHAEEVYPRPTSSSVLSLAGHGYGHGHGMSQWGAYGAASKGMTWRSIVGFYYPGTTLQAVPNSTIRVQLRILGYSNAVVYNSSSLQYSAGGSAFKTLGAPSAITRFRLQPSSTGLAMQQWVGGAWKAFATPASPLKLRDSRGAVTVGVWSSSRGDYVPRAYRGDIVVNHISSTQQSTVNTLLMEDYLKAVVPAEMPSSWSAEALKAQAVAARTYAAQNRAEPAARTRTYDTCDTTSCQMYSGMPAEAASTDAAIAATSGQMLMYGGSPAFTQFSASNGGYMVAGGQPYLVTKADPYDGAIPNSANSWTKDIPLTTIERTWPSIGSFQRMRVLLRDTHGTWGGRILSLALDGSKGSVTMSGTSFQWALGMRSEWFKPTNTTPLGPPTASWHDLSGDGRSDVLGVVGATGQLKLYPGTNLGAFQTPVVIGTGWGTFTGTIATTTWNADAVTDVLAQMPDGTIRLYPGTGSGRLGARTDIGRTMRFNALLGTGDFDGDGHKDLMGRVANGDLYLVRGNGNGGIVGQPTLVGKDWGVFTAVIGLDDFDGDGHPDVLARTRSGDLRLYPFTGHGSWGTYKKVGIGWAGMTSLTSPGDFTGDGHPDVLARMSDGTLRLYPGNGKGGWLTRRVIGLGWDALAPIIP